MRECVSAGIETLNLVPPPRQSHEFDFEVPSSLDISVALPVVCSCASKRQVMPWLPVEDTLGGSLLLIFALHASYNLYKK